MATYVKNFVHQFGVVWFLKKVVPTRHVQVRKHKVSESIPLCLIIINKQCRQITNSAETLCVRRSVS